jgi:hypothetical protein
MSINFLTMNFAHALLGKLGILLKGFCVCQPGEVRPHKPGMLVCTHA